MKVVLLSFLYEPELGGGAAMVVHQLARALVHRSHSVTVITTHKGNAIKTDCIDGVKIIRIPPMNLYWVGEKDQQPNAKKFLWQCVDIWNPFVYRLVRQILINEKPDVVHSHKLRGLSPSIWSAAASSGAKKIIHTCHDFELLSPEGLFMGKVGKLAQEQSLVIRPYQILRRGFSGLVDDATAPSRFVLDYHQKIGFFHRAQTRVVPNSHGLDEKELQRNDPDILKAQKKKPVRRFLYLGRLDKAKGIDLLCQAFLQLAGQKPDFLLRIAGWGPLDASLREKYINKVNIVFTGPVFGEQKAQLFHDSDVLVAPSIVPETFGIVITEAYSYGLLVITSTLGAFPEIVREGETGFLVKPGSVDALVSAMWKVSEERFSLNVMSRNCIEEAKKYTTEKFINDYLDVYREKL